MQKFLDQDSTYWKGKYAYHRHDLFYDLPRRKLLRGVKMHRNEYVSRVLKFLGKHILTLHAREIILDDERFVE